MREEILENLRLLEKTENINILYACESGSRAWGFPSADSDYDVRFIYIRERDWYLQVDLEHRRDVVEQPISGLLDVNGWDLQKALKLLRKSNPALIEWLMSPVVYRSNERFTAAFKQLIDECYSPRACFYHYAHMAAKNYREHLRGDTVKLKKYFYVLRSILAMQWIDQGRGVVPMEFEILVTELVDDVALKDTIQQLLEHKRLGVEVDYIPRNERLSQFIESELGRLDGKAQNQDKNVADYAVLNAFFLQALKGEFG